MLILQLNGARNIMGNDKKIRAVNNRQLGDKVQHD